MKNYNNELPLDNTAMKSLGLFFLFAVPALAADTNIVGKVVAVHDGNTLALRTEDETLKVRLFGIDTPELGQPFGNNAKGALSSLVFGKSVTVLSSGKDRYGRTLGVVFLGNGNVNEQMIRMGMAWHYRQYSDSVPMQQFEDYARMGKIGLWADPNPIAPWDWRKGKR